MKLTCIKPGCENQYDTDDPEPYYCPSCKAERKRVADEVDAKFATRVREPVVSDLQEFERTARVFKDPNTGREIFFGKA